MAEEKEKKEEKKPVKKKLPKVPKFESMAELTAWAKKLKPEIRNALTKEIAEATDKIINL